MELVARQLLALADSAAERFPPADEAEPIEQATVPGGFSFELMEDAELLRGPERLIDPALPDATETHVLPRPPFPGDNART